MYAAQETSAKEVVTVTEVVDGDTIHVAYSRGHSMTVRLLGVDTPETHHPTKPVGCFGPEAENFTRSKLEGRKVELEYDLQRYDKYGRTLAYVYFDNIRFNDILIQDGYARVLSIEPNTKYARTLSRIELEARKHGRGLWGYCGSDL